MQRAAGRYRDTSIGERIRKNINLLSLEGKPAPALDVQEHLGAQTAPLVGAARPSGPALLLGALVRRLQSDRRPSSNLQKTYGPKGLVVVGPTRLYGYVAGGEDAAPAAEKQYIEKVRAEYYSALAEVPVPVSSANFLTYGASSTPTLVLIDAAGIVRYYHPGAASESELAARIQKLLGSERRSGQLRSVLGRHRRAKAIVCLERSIS